MQEWIDLGYHDLFLPQDAIYRWVDEQYVVDGRLVDAHWPTSQWNAGLSCDWSVLSSPRQTARRLGGVLPACVLQFSVEDCLDLKIKVRHCPVIDSDSRNYNLAHCLLDPPDGRKPSVRRLRQDLEKRAKLLRIDGSYKQQFLSFVHGVRHYRRRRAVEQRIRDSIAQRASDGPHVGEPGRRRRDR